MRKRLLILAAVMCISVPATAAEDWSWASSGVSYCVENGIINGYENGDLGLGDNLTRAQMAKILCEAYDIESSTGGLFADVPQNHWAFSYISAIAPYMQKRVQEFHDSQLVTREEFAATLAAASGLTSASVRNSDILTDNFTDYDQVDPDYRSLLCAAVERGLMRGKSEGVLAPGDLLTRAEVCVLIERAKTGVDDPLELGVRQSRTPMTGQASCTVEEAQAWAASKGAHQHFIDIAPVYWQYGELTGIRPDILYAQAAKETAFGNYGGAVLPEQNNWAGIKKYGQNGDATEDHESFATPEEGVRARFNHMSAYVGLAPIGEPHGRYQSVASMSWAGTVSYLEELGGKWCPDLYYGFSILHNYLEEMG